MGNSRGNQAYILASAPLYDRWVRDNYDLQLWQTYLRMGTDDKHWAKDIVKKTKKRDDPTNVRFVQRKINQMTTRIAEANASISDLQIQLCTYWNHTTSGIAGATTTTAHSPVSKVRDIADRLEKVFLKYINHCTKHVKSATETKVKLARAELDEYRALKAFEQVASPAQWSTHSLLKNKMKVWDTKNTNYKAAAKRIELDLPPKFIAQSDCSFRIDESVIDKDEAQGLYNQMRKVTKEYRTQAMATYLKATSREREILLHDIDRIIEDMAQGRRDDSFDADPSLQAFKRYHQLRMQRLELHAEQSLHFLVKQRVEGDVDNDKEEVVAPTLVRSLGEDFSLQL